MARKWFVGCYFGEILTSWCLICQSMIKEIWVSKCISKCESIGCKIRFEDLRIWVFLFSFLTRANWRNARWQPMCGWECHLDGSVFWQKNKIENECVHLSLENHDMGTYFLVNFEFEAASSLTHGSEKPDKKTNHSLMCLIG